MNGAKSFACGGHKPNCSLSMYNFPWIGQIQLQTFLISVAKNFTCGLFSSLRKEGWHWIGWIGTSGSWSVLLVVKPHIWQPSLLLHRFTLQYRLVTACHTKILASTRSGRFWNRLEMFAVCSSAAAPSRWSGCPAEALPMFSVW